MPGDHHGTKFGIKWNPNPDCVTALETFSWGEISMKVLETTLTKMVGSPVRQNPMMRAFGPTGFARSRASGLRAHIWNGFWNESGASRCLTRT